MCISFSFILLTKIPSVAKFTSGPPEGPEGQNCLVLWSVSSFSQIMFLLEKQNWRIKSWISAWPLKPMLEYNGSLNLLSCFTDFLGKDIEIDSNCYWAWYRTVVSCSFICSTAIKLRWLLGLNHSPGYLSPPMRTYSCLVIVIHCTKGGRGEHSCDMVSCLHWWLVLFVSLKKTKATKEMEEKKKKNYHKFTKNVPEYIFLI